ncbi:MAG: hypothetical protein WCH99_15890 [Verrucomicrobiota bacterium]
MKTEALYQTLVVALLAGVLATQIAILHRTSRTVTLGDCLNKKLTKEQKMALLQALPLVRVNGTVDVDIQNNPLEVEIENTPVDVQIQR